MKKLVVSTMFLAFTAVAHAAVVFQPGRLFLPNNQATAAASAGTSTSSTSSFQPGRLYSPIHVSQPVVSQAKIFQPGRLYYSNEVDVTTNTKIFCQHVLR